MLERASAHLALEGHLVVVDDRMSPKVRVVGEGERAVRTVQLPVDVRSHVDGDSMVSGEFVLANVAFELGIIRGRVVFPVMVEDVVAAFAAHGARLQLPVVVQLMNVDLYLKAGAERLATEFAFEEEAIATVVLQLHVDLELANAAVVRWAVRAARRERYIGMVELHVQLETGIVVQFCGTLIALDEPMVGEVVSLLVPVSATAFFTGFRTHS